jgi:hypothetical protein
MRKTKVSKSIKPSTANAETNSPSIATLNRSVVVFQRNDAIISALPEGSTVALIHDNILVLDLIQAALDFYLYTPEASIMAITHFDSLFLVPSAKLGGGSHKQNILAGNRAIMDNKSHYTCGWGSCFGCR